MIRGGIDKSKDGGDEVPGTSRFRVSPAMVVALAALLVALGGTIVGELTQHEATQERILAFAFGEMHVGA